MIKEKRGGRRGGSGDGIDPANIKNVQDLVSQRERNQAEVDETLTALGNMYKEYNIAVDTLSTADIVGKDANVMAFCDANGDITINTSYFNSKAMNNAMDRSFEDGFHPSRGNKSGIEATVSHEFGHTLTHIASQKMGGLNMYEASARIVNEARKITGDKGVIIMAKKISKYATYSNAEAIAEALSDCYCNGSKATAQSKAIKSVLDKYVK